MADTDRFTHTESHMQTGAICPLLTRSALFGDTAHFAHTDHACTQASSTHRSCCSLIQHSGQTMPTSLLYVFVDPLALRCGHNISLR